MPSIATVYVEVLPETSQIAAGIERAFREVDLKARDAGKRWAREIQAGLTGVDIKLEADTAKAKEEIRSAAEDQKATIEVDADTAKAEAQIDVAARDRKANIKVDVDQASFSQIKGDIEKIGSEFSKIGSTLAGPLKLSFVIEGASLLPNIVPVIGQIISAVQQLSGALLLLPAAFSAIGTGFGVLKIGLSGISDAYTAMSTASKSAGVDATAHASAVASASRTLTSAINSERSAQQAVTQARKDARQQLEDLNSTLKDGMINEAQAKLDLQKAQQELATGMFQTSTDYEQAQLNVISAQNRLDEAHTRNNRNQQDANTTRQQGVDGNPAVVAAEDRLTQAVQAAADAQKALNDANNQVSSSAKAASDAMAQLSPNAQAFVNTLVGLQPTLQAFKFAIQDALTANFGPQLQGVVNTILPAIQPGLTRVATAFNTAFQGIANWLQKPENVATIQTIINNIATAFERLAPAVQPLLDAFATLTKAGSGFLPQLASTIGDLATKFGNFIQNANDTGKLDTWIQNGITAFGQLKDIVVNVWNTLSGIFRVASGPGGSGGLLKNLDDLTTKWSAWVNSPEGQNKISKFFADAKAEWEKWWPIIQRLPGMIQDAVTAIRPIIDALVAIIQGVSWALTNIPGAINIAIGAFALFKGAQVVGAIKSVVDLIGGITGGLGGIGPKAATAGTELAGGLTSKLGAMGFLFEAGVWTLPITALVIMNQTWTDTTSPTAKTHGTTEGRKRAAQIAAGRPPNTIKRLPNQRSGNPDYSKYAPGDEVDQNTAGAVPHNNRWVIPDVNDAGTEYILPTPQAPSAPSGSHEGGPPVAPGLPPGPQPAAPPGTPPSPEGVPPPVVAPGAPVPSTGTPVFVTNWPAGGVSVAGAPGSPGVPGSGGEPTIPLVQGPNGTWTSSNPAWAALIQRESTGSPTVVNTKDANAIAGNPSSGLFQITISTWAANGGTQFAPTAGEATPQQQAIVAARIIKKNPSGADWGAGGPGRENAAELVAGVSPGAPSPAVPGAPGSIPNVPGEQVGTTGARLAINSALNLNVPSGWNAPDTFDEHSGGNAFDVMVSNKAEGDKVVAEAFKNPNVDYVIWQQATRYPDGRVSPMGDRGTPTKNHMDHVHVHVVSTGYAAGNTPEETGKPRGANAIPYPASPSVPSTTPTTTPGQIQLNPNIPPGQQAGDKDQAKGKGEDLGKNFVAGLFEAFGFDGSVFKDPSQFGIVKLGTALFNYFNKLGTAIANPDQSGNANAAPGAPGAPGDGGGGGLASFLTGFIPQPFGPPQPADNTNTNTNGAAVDNSIHVHDNNFRDADEVLAQVRGDQLEQIREPNRNLPTPPQ